jgi:hypothetical protein
MYRHSSSQNCACTMYWWIVRHKDVGMDKKCDQKMDEQQFIIHFFLHFFAYFTLYVIRTTQNLLLLLLFINENEIWHFFLSRKRKRQWNFFARRRIGLIKTVVNTRSDNRSFEKYNYYFLKQILLSTCLNSVVVKTFRCHT